MGSRRRPALVVAGRGARCVGMVAVGCPVAGRSSGGLPRPRAGVVRPDEATTAPLVAGRMRPRLTSPCRIVGLCHTHGGGKATGCLPGHGRHWFPTHPGPGVKGLHVASGAGSVGNCERRVPHVMVQHSNRGSTNTHAHQKSFRLVFPSYPHLTFVATQPRCAALRCQTDSVSDHGTSQYLALGRGNTHCCVSPTKERKTATSPHTGRVSLSSCSGVAGAEFSDINHRVKGRCAALHNLCMSKPLCSSHTCLCVVSITLVVCAACCGVVPIGPVPR